MILNGSRCVCYIFLIILLSDSTVDNTESKSIQDLPDGIRATHAPCNVGDIHLQLDHVPITKIHLLPAAMMRRIF